DVGRRTRQPGDAELANRRDAEAFAAHAACSALREPPAFAARSVSLYATHAACWSQGRPWDAIGLAISFSPIHPAMKREMARHASLLREIVGNPFRPVAVDASWLARNDGAVRRIARTIHDEHAFDQTPILADALEDAGCADDAILTHLRGPGPHVRGCWA